MGLLGRIGKKLKVLSSSAPPPVVPRAPRPEIDDDEPASPRPAGQPVDEWIRATLGANRVVLFMKGSPASPQCGFSASAVQIVGSNGVPFHAVDVLSDPEIRDGIKAYSGWPTLPQLFVDGELVGGADILAEMQASGELSAKLRGQTGRS